MTNGTSTRGSKILVGAIALMIGASATFAGTLIPLSPRVGGDNIQPVPPVSGGGPGGNNILVATDGVWTFNTNGTAAPWSTTTNWSGGVIADGGGFADFSTINIGGARNPVVDTTSRTVRRLDIGDTDGAQSYTISASGSASLIFDNTANSANAQLNQTSGSHGDIISAPIILNSSLDVTNASSATLTLSGAISGVGALNLGSGTLALGTSANSYGGGTTISGGGKITIGASGTPLGSGSLTLAGGTLVSTGSRTVTATDVILTANSALTTTSTAATVNMPFSGTLTGTAGTLTIRNDAASGTGQFDVRFSGADYTMSRPIVIDNGAGTSTARLSDFNLSGSTHTYSGVISGNGSYNRSSSGPAGGLTVFTADNTYTGSTTVNSGTLQLGIGGTTGSLSPSSTISIAAAGTLRFDHTSGADFVQGTNFSSAAITGAGKIIKDGTSSLTFNVANTFAGGLTINKGTVIALADGALGTGNVSLTAGSITLTLQSGATNNYIADSATLSYVSTDIINLTYTGTDTVTGLTVDGVAQGAGVYGASFINPDGVFAGTGSITVVPEPTTVAMMVLGGSLLVGMQRFRRKLR